MMKTMVQYIRSIYSSISSILSSLTRKAGQGGNIVLRGGGKAISEIMAVILTVLIVFLIGVASLTVSAAQTTLNSFRNNEQREEWLHPVSYT